MHSFKLLIAQIGVILIAARITGWLFRKLHQPHVIGEMVAGILLGPSLLGWVAPGVSAALFPSDSLGRLNSLSQVGILLFMFLVGLELDLKKLRALGPAAVITSQVSIILPFILGFLLAFYLYPRFSDPSVSFIGFALFISIAMSITAFPVLARILTEGHLTHDSLALILLLVLASGWITESLGVHALFGAFLAGVVMPRHHELSREIWQKVEALIVTLLLPLYFAFTGLRSSFFLIAGATMWMYCAVIIALAIIGKLGGSLFAARITGMSWREAAAVGVLMNTRGLVELVILNIGLDSG